MKIKYCFFALSGLFLYSCSPKIVAMQPSDPVVPQMPAQTSISVDSANRIAEGKSIYENSCAKCHKLFSPTERSKEDWPGILMKMQPKAHLNDSQMALISEYVQSEAK